MPKRALIWVGLILAAVLSIFVFWGEFAAGRTRIPASAEPTPGFSPWLNSRLYQSRARALFDRGLSRLGEPAARDADFRRAYDFFLRSLVLNPFSAVTHFDFGQALQYFNALDFEVPERYFDEYRKAAGLSGVDTSVYLEVGKVLLSRWSGLNPDERLFTERILRTLLSFGGPERSRRAEVLLNLWEVNVRDALILQKILPEDAATLRQAAAFLGGKGFFLDARLDFLARAEGLDLKTAADDFQAGLSERNARRPAEALRYFRDAARLLDGICFFMNLTPEKNALNQDEYHSLRKSVRLGILKCLLDTSAEPKDLLDDFRAYLEVEDSIGAVAELESLFKARGVIDAQARTGFIDFIRLSLGLELSFKQNRYREVGQMGQSLSQNLLVVPEDQRRPYGRIFELVGEAFQRLDDLYESNLYYEKALTLNPGDAVVLIKMRRNYERLNDGPALQQLAPRIEAGLTPRQTPLIDEVWSAGEVRTRTLILDEKTYRLAIDFSDFSAGPPPLISVIFNGRAIGEAFLSSDLFETSLAAVAGSNELRISSVNRICRPIRLTIIPEDEDSGGSATLSPRQKRPR